MHLEVAPVIRGLHFWQAFNLVWTPLARFFVNTAIGVQPPSYFQPKSVRYFLLFLHFPERCDTMTRSHLSYCRNITHDVGCKPVEGAAGLSLNSTAPAPAPAPPGLDLDLESSPGEIDTNLTLQLFIFHILLPMHRLHPWPPSDEKVKVKARKCFSLRLSSKSGSISAHLFRRSDSCYPILVFVNH